MKDVAGYEGLYAITENGEVWSYKSNKFLKGCPKNGYKFVTLHKSGIAQKCYVHRLVAETFIPNPNNFPCVNHKDEDKTNNCVSNLEWCTHEHNMNYGTRNERISESHKKHIICAETNEIFKSMTEAALTTGISKQNISACCNGKRKTAGGYHWEFAV